MNVQSRQREGKFVLFLLGTYFFEITASHEYLIFNTKYFTLNYQTYTLFILINNLFIK